MGKAEAPEKSGLEVKGSRYIPDYGGGGSDDGNGNVDDENLDSLKEISSNESNPDNLKYKPSPNFGEKNRNGEENRFEDDKNEFYPIQMGKHP